MLLNVTQTRYDVFSSPEVLRLYIRCSFYSLLPLRELAFFLAWEINVNLIATVSRGHRKARIGEIDHFSCIR